MHALQEHNGIPVMKSSMGINSKPILVEKDHLGDWTPITLMIFFNQGMLLLGSNHFLSKPMIN